MRKGSSMAQNKSVWMKTFGIMLALVIVLPGAAVVSAADSYPNRPVHLIVASSPGGSTDFVGRVIATRLSDALGQQVVVENRGGAGGSIATEHVMRTDPDGYTLLFTSAQFVQRPLLYKVRYDTSKSFVPVAKMGTCPNALTVHPSVPANSLKELIALAKKQPGELITASAGNGSFTHLATAYFAAMAGINLKIIQFKGSGPALLDLIGGHCQVSLVSFTAALPQIRAGKLRALGIGALTRNKALPDVPTISEAGLPGYEASQWWAIFAPAGTPKAIADRLYKGVAAVMGQAETQKAFEDQGADPDLLGPDEFVTFIGAETAKWAKVIKDSNIKVKK